MANWHLNYYEEFSKDLFSLDKAVLQDALKTINLLVSDPDHPSLRTKPVKNGESGLRTSRVGKDHRLIWKHIKPTEILPLFIETRAKVYSRAMRVKTVIQNGLTQIIDVTTTDATSYEGKGGLFSTYTDQGSKRGKLFISYLDREILELGVPEEYLPNIRALDSIDQVMEFEGKFSPETFNNLLTKGLGIIEREEVPDEKLSRSLIENEGGNKIHRIQNSEELQKVLDGEFEDWMLFLETDQKILSRRNFNGPARVKGVAGSGKSVVGIHRACYLAKHAKAANKKVLFLTFGNTLPPIINYLLKKKLSGDPDLINYIDCRTVHSLAGSILFKNKIQLRINTSITRQVIAKTLDQVKKKVVLSKSLAKRGAKFFEDEIKYVIKGKALKNLDEYLQLERSGRGTRMSDGDRRVIWKIYEEYQEEMKNSGYSDYDDVILQALKILEDGTQINDFHAVIVDEIQDLTESEMMLIRKIVPPGKNDVFLIGDGLQKIYPGGYTLSKVGIDIVGRSTLLRKNYRNTQEILQAAQIMMEDVEYDDPDGTTEKIDLKEISLRNGDKPKFVSFSQTQDEVSWIKSEIERLIIEDNFVDKDFVIIVPQNKPFEEEIKRAFEKDQLLVKISSNPETYFGSGIKWTTYHSSKGLEFKVVFLMGVTDGLYVPRDDPSIPQDEMEDSIALQRRLLYVAMTRARDLLYLTCSRGQPSRFLNNIPESILIRLKP